MDGHDDLDHDGGSSQEDDDEDEDENEKKVQIRSLLDHASVLESIGITHQLYHLT